MNFLFSLLWICKCKVKYFLITLVQYFENIFEIMYKYMNYNELKKAAESKRILISEISEAVGMTSTGFKRSIETGSFPIGKVKDLCEILQITISEFFGEEQSQTPTMASERVPYSLGVPKNTPTTDTVERLVSHIAWLQDEIDRLRAAQQQKGKKIA